MPLEWMGSSWVRPIACQPEGATRPCPIRQCYHPGVLTPEHASEGAGGCCKMQIPGDPSGVRTGAQESASYQTVMKEDSLMVPGSAPGAPSLSLQERSLGWAWDSRSERPQGAGSPSPDAVQGLAFGILGGLRHCQALAKNPASHLDAMAISHGRYGSCTRLSLLPHATDGEVAVTPRKGSGRAGVRPHPVTLQPRTLPPPSKFSPMAAPWETNLRKRQALLM